MLFAATDNVTQLLVASHFDGDTEESHVLKRSMESGCEGK